MEPPQKSETDFTRIRPVLFLLIANQQTPLSMQNDQPIFSHLFFSLPIQKMLNFNGRIKNTPDNQQPVQSTHSKKQEEPITAIL